MNITDFIKREFASWNKVELIVFPLLCLIIFFVSIYMKDNLAATISAICGLLYTIFSGKGKVYCYIFGITGTVCYSYLSLKNFLLATLALQMGYYLPMYIVGIYNWKKHLKTDKNEIIKTKQPLKSNIILLVAIIFLSVILAICLSFAGEQHPYLDSFITILSVAGMYLTVKRCIEQWLVWITADILSVILWLQIFLAGERVFATILIYFIYLILGIYFFIQWKKEMNLIKN